MTLFYLLAGHGLADFALQSEWMARAKNRNRPVPASSIPPGHRILSRQREREEGGRVMGELGRFRSNLLRVCIVLGCSWLSYIIGARHFAAERANLAKSPPATPTPVAYMTRNVGGHVVYECPMAPEPNETCVGLVGDELRCVPCPWNPPK